MAFSRGRDGLFSITGRRGTVIFFELLREQQRGGKTAAHGNFLDGKRTCQLLNMKIGKLYRLLWDRMDPDRGNQPRTEIARPVKISTTPRILTRVQCSFRISTPSPMPIGSPS